MLVLLGHFLFSFFQYFFDFELDFSLSWDYNIGSENEETRNRYGDCI